MLLAFDTSQSHCAACIMQGDNILASRTEAMARGQAERLFPLLESLLDEVGASWADLTRIGVGVGPGNFTGIRISVAAARGLALSLDIPAVGVSTLEAQALDALDPVTSVVDARGGRAYAQTFPNGEPELLDVGILPDGHLVGEDISGAKSPAHPLIEAIARIAQSKPRNVEPPKPLYIRPADAAPARDNGPTILD